MQRLTKYQLLLKDLVDATNIVCGRPELEEALAELLTVIKTVNDSLHSVTIRGLPAAVNPLGPMITHSGFQVRQRIKLNPDSFVYHESFQVTSDNKGQSQILFSRNKAQRREVFIYENHVVFAKVVNEKSALYTFKMAMATSSLGMSGVVRGDDKKMELWVHGRNDLYTLEAIKGRKAKDDFAAELRKARIMLTIRIDSRPISQVFFPRLSSDKKICTREKLMGRMSFMWTRRPLLAHPRRLDT